MRAVMEVGKGQSRNKMLLYFSRAPGRQWMVVPITDASKWTSVSLQHMGPGEVAACADSSLDFIVESGIAKQVGFAVWAMIGL